MTTDPETTKDDPSRVYPSDIHRAIDQTTILIIQIERLARQLSDNDPDVAAMVAAMDAELARLAIVLKRIRDGEHEQRTDV